jgi:hypothetical protein
MVYKNLAEELSYKFTNLSSLKPNKVRPRISLFANVLTDEFVYNMSPQKYEFYQEFERQIQNDPELLKNIIYENKLIKANRESEAVIIDKLVNRLNRLYVNEGLNEMTGNDYLTEKKKLRDKENKKLVDRLFNIIKTYDVDGANEVGTRTLLDTTFADEKVGGGTDTGYGVGGIGDGDGVGGIGAGDGVVAGDSVFNQASGPTSYQYDSPMMPQQPQQDASMPKEKTGEKVAFERIKKEVDDLYENKIVQKNASQSDIKLLQEHLSNVINLERKWNNIKMIRNRSPPQMPDNLQNNMEDLEEKDIRDLKTNIKNYIEEINKNLIKPIENAKDDLKKDINKKHQEVEEKKIKYADNFEKKGLNQAKKIKDDFKDDPNNHLHFFKNELQKVLNSDEKDASIKASKLADIIDEIENNEFTSIESLKLSRSDRLVFIGVTFIIRMICLVLIDWALNTNYVVSFTQAYVLYVVLYCIFVMLIIAIVNMTYVYPYHRLYRGNHSLFTAFGSSLYYFYLIPGNFISNSVRFIIHFMLIIFLTLIAVFIKANETTEDNILNYDYSERKKIRRVLSNFTILLWFFTSVIAMYMF